MEKSNEKVAPDSLKITALNLSEDMSRLSTKNDEVFVFIYDYSDTNELKAPLVSTKLIFDKDNLTYSIFLPKTEKSILFFIEEDSFRNNEQIEPVVRVYFKEIRKCNGYNELKKYLGEDDLLGVKIFDSNTSSFSLSGTSSLDKYEYNFLIKY